MKGKLKYVIPDEIRRFKVEQEIYSKWLHRKASSLFLRDKRRSETDNETTHSFGQIWNKQGYSRAKYKEMIHLAVVRSKGLDDYTGEKLQWKKIGTFGDDGFVRINLLPTVDHENPKSGKIKFKICSWILNSVKSDLTIKELKHLVSKI